MLLFIDKNEHKIVSRKDVNIEEFLSKKVDFSKSTPALLLVPTNKGEEINDGYIHYVAEQSWKHGIPIIITAQLIRDNLAIYEYLKKEQCSYVVIDRDSMDFDYYLNDPDNKSKILQDLKKLRQTQYGVDSQFRGELFGSGAMINLADDPRKFFNLLLELTVYGTYDDYDTRKTEIERYWAELRLRFIPEDENVSDIKTLIKTLFKIEDGQYSEIFNSLGAISDFDKFVEYAQVELTKPDINIKSEEDSIFDGQHKFIAKIGKDGRLWMRSEGGLSDEQKGDFVNFVPTKFTGFPAELDDIFQKCIGNSTFTLSPNLDSDSYKKNRDHILRALTAATAAIRELKKTNLIVLAQKDRCFGLDSVFTNEHIDPSLVPDSIYIEKQEEIEKQRQEIEERDAEIARLKEQAASRVAEPSPPPEEVRAEEGVRAGSTASAIPNTSAFSGGQVQTPNLAIGQAHDDLAQAQSPNVLPTPPSSLVPYVLVFPAVLPGQQLTPAVFPGISSFPAVLPGQQLTPTVFQPPHFTAIENVPDDGQDSARSSSGELSVAEEMRAGHPVRPTSQQPSFQFQALALPSDDLISTEGAVATGTRLTAPTPTPHRASRATPNISTTISGDIISATSESTSEVLPELAMQTYNLPWLAGTITTVSSMVSPPVLRASHNSADDSHSENTSSPRTPVPTPRSPDATRVVDISKLDRGDNNSTFIV